LLGVVAMAQAGRGRLGAAGWASAGRRSLSDINLAAIAPGGRVPILVDDELVHLISHADTNAGS
jgi:hypothetical protein